MLDLNLRFRPLTEVGDAWTCDFPLATLTPKPLTSEATQAAAADVIWSLDASNTAFILLTMTFKFPLFLLPMFSHLMNITFLIQYTFLYFSGYPDKSCPLKM